MNQKEILTIGIIAAFVFAATIAVIPVEAQNSIAKNSDDDDIVISGIGNTATTSSTQASTVAQANVNTDNDVQVSTADTCLEVC